MRDAGLRLVEIADDLRALATNGLFWPSSEYDKARYEKCLGLAADLLAMADSRSAEEIERIFRGDLTGRTPFVGVDAAIFDEEGRILLVQRADSGRWCIPGGAAEVGETPSENVRREALEETGLIVEVERLVGIFDARVLGSSSPYHIYQVLFLCRAVGGELTASNETSAHGYFAEEEALALDLHGGHRDLITYAFAAHRGEMVAGGFH